MPCNWYDNGARWKVDANTCTPIKIKNIISMHFFLRFMLNSNLLIFWRDSDFASYRERSCKLYIWMHQKCITFNDSIFLLQCIPFLWGPNKKNLTSEQNGPQARWIYVGLYNAFSVELFVIFSIAFWMKYT